MTAAGGYILPFLIILTILVFVHEWGHYWVARRAGVKVEAFSIGFGPEIFGWTDRSGTRWRIAALPLGGYVRMYGEGGEQPQIPSEPVAHHALKTTTCEDEAFYSKPLAARAAIVAAGPLTNFLFAILLLAGLFATVGQPYTPADIGTVIAGGAAEQAGLQPGDKVLAVDGSAIQRFEEVQQVVQLHPEETLRFLIERQGSQITVPVTPRATEVKDTMGGSHRIGMIGISRSGTARVRHNPGMAVWQAMRETWRLTTGTLTAVGQMIVGQRSADELGGPIRIAKMSSEAAKTDFPSMIWFVAYLSISLGIINLFPVPMLDGGHLLFYAIESVRGRPLGLQAQEYGTRIGLALVLCLMLFATWNDLIQLRIFDFLKI
ncbi:MAG: RIP metalloprotease RseP [Alphaproteobacteria bacterium]